MNAAEARAKASAKFKETEDKQLASVLTRIAIAVESGYFQTEIPESSCPTNVQLILKNEPYNYKILTKSKRKFYGTCWDNYEGTETTVTISW